VELLTANHSSTLHTMPDMCRYSESMP